MNKIVVYQSSTGFTKQYATWIARECNCKAIDIKKVSAEEIHKYDVVIFGGWIMGNSIRGLEKARKWNPKKLIVFAVGASPDSDKVRTAIKEQNHLEDVEFYYFEGGFRFNELNFFVRTMLKAMKKSIAKKENKTEEDLYMEQVLGTSFDHSNKKEIVPLISYVREAL